MQLPRDFRFPEGQSEVLVRREGNRVILEPIDEWPEDFRACLGAWTEEIERPHVILGREAAPAPHAVRVAPNVPQDEKSGVSAFFGTWPGDETEDDLLKALKAIG